MQTNNGRFTVLPGFIVAEEIMSERQVTEFAFMADKTLYWRPMPKPYDFTHSDERNEEFSRLEVEGLLSFKTGELDYFAEREKLNSFDTVTGKIVLHAWVAKVERDGRDEKSRKDLIELALTEVNK